MSLTKKQHAQRAQGIGASEIAVLVGLSRWSTPIEIWRRKLGIGESADVGSYARDLGVEIEEPIAAAWAKRAKKTIARVATLQHPEHPLALATPDRAVFSPDVAPPKKRGPLTDLLGAESLLEVKSTNWRQAGEWGAEGSDRIPTEYLCQAHWQGAVAGMSEVLFAVDVDKTRLRTYRVRVDLDFFGSLYDAAEKFWTDHVLARVPPPPDGSLAYLETVQKMFGTQTSRDLVDVQGDAFDELRQTVLRFVRLKDLAAKAKDAITAERSKILLAIEGRGGLTWQDADGPVVLTYNQNKPSTVVEWQGVAGEAQLLAALAIQSMPEGDRRAELDRRLKALVSEKTSQVPGDRVLRLAKIPKAWAMIDDDAPLALPSNVSPT